MLLRRGRADKMEQYMLRALKEAKKAALKDEVPIGAVIVKDDVIISCGHNIKEAKKNPLCHAEIVAINKACNKLKSWRLEGCDIYVTLEPCAMCAGAIIQARIKRIIFGAYDAKAGCCGTLYNLPSDTRFNHRSEVTGGVLKEECASLLTEFFKSKR